MAEFDERHNRLTVKIVYYGPGMSGKTTNLTRLHDLLSTEMLGNMMSLDTQGDRTLFFDLLPLGFLAPSGLQIKFKLYTVPGQAVHDSTRKAVLSRADGVMFVADSQCNQAVNNTISFENLLSNVATLGMDVARLPLVVQFNKRDMPDIVSEAQIHARWASAPWPLRFASALQGDGVLECFTVLLESVYDHLDQAFSLAGRHCLPRDAFIGAARGPTRGPA